MFQDVPELCDSDSDIELDGEEIQSSPRDFHGFGSGPAFRVAEKAVVKVEGFLLEEDEVLNEEGQEDQDTKLLRESRTGEEVRDRPYLSDSDSDSELDGEEMPSSPRDFYGFGPGPGFLVAEKVEVKVHGADVEDREVGEVGEEEGQKDHGAKRLMEQGAEEDTPVGNNQVI